MNPVNHKKLLHGKWTATMPRNREKHFIVTGVNCDELNIPLTCVLEAVHSGREIIVDWRDFKDSTRWRTVWQ